MPEIPDEVYAAGGKAMVPWSGDDEDVSLFEWHHCISQPACRGAVGPCPCAGMPWPSEPVRAAIEAAYRDGREDAARDVLALSDAELPRGHVDRAWIALVARGGPGQDHGAHAKADALSSVAAPCTCRWCRNRAGRG